MKRAFEAADGLRWFLAAGFATLAVYATVQLGRGTPPFLSWMGLLLAAGAPLAGILTHQDKTSRPPLLWTAFSGLGLAITMAISHRYGTAAGPVHVWAGAALISWYAWVRWRHRAQA